MSWSNQDTVDILCVSEEKQTNEHHLKIAKMLDFFMYVVLQRGCCLLIEQLM